ncbi:MAG: prepilin-type N-terminal cleavage/methylation domain-containing protein, partial [Gammaproteobacteria bacterium]|nr:prepilin-type N-terminal cleavage/methylation domain-containing protein [Gammaproteobacteria bacterium]
MNKVRSNQGFTLLEIIVVVAIIAILAAYIAPKV